MTKPVKDWEQAIGEFSRNGTTKVVLKVGVYRDKPFVDLRTYFLPDDGTDFIGTKKGVRIHADSLGTLIESLQKADVVLCDFYAGKE